MFRTAIVFAIFVIALCQGASFNTTIELNATQGASFFIYKSNLKTSVKFSFTTSNASDLVFCFQEQFNSAVTAANVVVSENSQFWHGVCSHYFEVKSNQTNYSQALDLLMIPYAVGVFFKNASTSPATLKVTVMLDGESCQANEVSDAKGSCIPVTAVVGNKITIPASNVSAFNFKLPSDSLTGMLNISCTGNASFTYMVRRDGSPSYKGMAGTCPGAPLSIPAPQNGLEGYFLVVDNSALNQTLELDIKLETCKNMTGGAGCTLSIMDGVFAPNTPMLSTNIVYFRVNATIGSLGVWVNVRTNNASEPPQNVVNPMIFASLNQLPTSQQTADVKGCTSYYCDYVQTIRFNVTVNQTWYVGIQFVNQYFNGTVGVWFNDICAPRCGDHGTCDDAPGPTQGFCDCIDGFIGVDCATAHGFGPQFIVLIIIAVLVCLTALIGFGAWAYMKRKRGHYDVVA